MTALEAVHCILSEVNIVVSDMKTAVSRGNIWLSEPNMAKTSLPVRLLPLSFSGPLLPRWRFALKVNLSRQGAQGAQGFHYGNVEHLETLGDFLSALTVPNTRGRE